MQSRTSGDDEFKDMLGSLKFSKKEG